MSAPKQNFFAAHWDWLVALVGLAALAGAGAMFALALGESPESGAASYQAQLNAKHPAHEGVAAADLSVLDKAFRSAKTPPTLQGVDPKKASFLASERRVVCQQGDTDPKAKKGCRRPIPSGLEECPFCGVKQKVVKVEVDTDHDGLPNDWEKKYGLNPDDASDAKKDADGDGFTNLEEFQAGTDPKDKSSHPDYMDSLSLAGAPQQTFLPFYFNAVTPIPGGHRFTFKRVGVSGFDSKVSVKLNQEIAGTGGKNPWKSGWSVVAFEKKEELRLRPGTNVKVKTDVSTVDVKRTSDGKILKITMNDSKIAVETQAELLYNRGEERKIVISEGAEFELNGQKYRVAKLKAENNGCEITVVDLKTKKEKIIR